MNYHYGYIECDFSNDTQFSQLTFRQFKQFLDNYDLKLAEIIRNMDNAIKGFLPNARTNFYIPFTLRYEDNSKSIRKEMYIRRLKNDMYSCNFVLGNNSSNFKTKNRDKVLDAIEKFLETHSLP